MQTAGLGKRHADILAVLLLAAVWALVVAVVGVGGDYALNDDWAYAYTARHLLRTGELRILDWAAPSLATHALWGAGALRLLGDSAVSLRCGTLAWALGAVLCLHGLAREAFAPRVAVMVALGLALSPWFVGLGFSYLTDVPWLAMMLAALLVFTRALHPRSAEPPRRALLALAGALVGAAALSRQFAIITTPAFAIVLGLDARRRDGARWAWPALRGCLWFGAPVGALFLPFQLWYTHVHGATQANRETLANLGAVPASLVAVHLACILHYAGLWLSPVALALLVQRRLREVVSARLAGGTLAVLGGYAVAQALSGRVDAPSDMVHPLMPYMGNVVYLVGIGPPTLSDAYWGREPMPHAWLWPGVVLTVASTFGAVVGAGLLATTVRRVRRAWAEPEEGASRRELLRVLLLGFAGAYLLWHLSTGSLIFDRYLLPLLPAVLWLGLDAAPEGLGRSPILVACAVVSGLVSVAGTREYLSWNDARDRAVRALDARGVPAADVDGGFEANGPRHFEAFRQRTGKLLHPGAFWVTGAPYRLSFGPARDPGCVTVERYPYWTWPGGGERAVYTLRCAAGDD